MNPGSATVIVSSGSPWHNSAMFSQFTKIRILVVIGIFCLAGVFYIFFYRDRTKNIANFDECVAGGYAVIESLPRRCLDPDAIVHTEDVGTMVEMQHLIRIKVPERNTIMVDPLIVDGEVHESWFRQGSIEALLVDEKDIVLGRSTLEAQQKIRGTEFVRFSGKFNWELKDDVSVKGTIILRARNSGIGIKNVPQEVRMPVFLRSK